MIITAKGTFTDAEALDFAKIKLGYKETIEADGVIKESKPNPVSVEEHITKAFNEYIGKFFDGYQTPETRQALAQAQATLKATQEAVKEAIEAKKAESIQITVK
jgi:hypothetical protein